MKNNFLIVFILFFYVNLSAEVLTLEKCFDSALENFPTVRSAQARMDQARARMVQARSGFLPKLTGSAVMVRLDTAPYVSMKDFADMLETILRQYIPPGFWPPDTGSSNESESQRMKMGSAENYDITLGFQQPLFTGFALTSGYKISKLGIKNAELDMRGTRENLLQSVEIAYWNVVKARGFLESAEKSKQQVSAHIATLQALERQGMVSKTDVLSAQVRESEMELLVLKARQAVSLSKLALATLTGIPVEEIEIEPIEQTDEDIFKSPENTMEMVIAGNTDMKRIDNALEIADLSITVSASQLYPMVFVGGNWHYKKPNRELEEKWYDSWDLNAGISLNIFDWGMTIGKIREAQAMKRELESTRESALIGLELQTQSAFSAYIEAIASEEVARKQVALAQENMRITNEKFQNQTATSTQILDAQSDLLRSEVNLINNIADRAIAKTSLMKLTGDYTKYFEKD